jgi:phosphatidylglycerophosphate synthase
MLGIHARPVINRLFRPLGTRLVAWGVTPNMITVVGTVGVVGGALGFYPRGSFLWGTVVITCFVFSDSLDGVVARISGSTGVYGAFLDSTLDRFGDAAIFGGIALYWAGPGDDQLVAGVALFTLALSLITSYVKARAEGLGMTCNVGLVERPERLVAILVATGFAGIFDVNELQVAVLWVLAVTAAITVGQRLAEVRRQALALSRPA